MPLDIATAGIEAEFNKALMNYARANNDGTLQVLISAAHTSITPEVLARTIKVLLTEEGGGLYLEIFNYLVNHQSALVRKTKTDDFVDEAFLLHVINESDARLIDSYLRLFNPENGLLEAKILRLIESSNVIRLGEIISHCPFLLNKLSPIFFEKLYAVVNRSVEAIGVPVPDSPCLTVDAINLFVSNAHLSIIANWNLCKGFITWLPSPIYSKYLDTSFKWLVKNREFLIHIFSKAEQTDRITFIRNVANPFDVEEILKSLTASFDKDSLISLINIVKDMNLIKSANMHVSYDGDVVVSLISEKLAMSDDISHLQEHGLLLAGIRSYDQLNMTTDLAAKASAGDETHSVSLMLSSADVLGSIPSALLATATGGPLAGGLAFVKGVFAAPAARAAYQAVRGALASSRPLRKSVTTEGEFEVVTAVSPSFGEETEYDCLEDEFGEGEYEQLDRDTIVGTILREAEETVIQASLGRAAAIKDAAFLHQKALSATKPVSDSIADDVGGCEEIGREVPTASAAAMGRSSEGGRAKALDTLLPAAVVPIAEAEVLVTVDSKVGSPLEHESSLRSISASPSKGFVAKLLLNREEVPDLAASIPIIVPASYPVVGDHTALLLAQALPEEALSGKVPEPELAGGSDDGSVKPVVGAYTAALASNNGDVAKTNKSKKKYTGKK